jgi:hypothetical protein
MVRFASTTATAADPSWTMRRLRTVVSLGELDPAGRRTGGRDEPIGME